MIKIKPVSHKFRILYKRARYKVLYGGRSSGKSWAVAEALIFFALSCRVRILCCRQIEGSIAASAQQLICDTISRYGVQDEFEITRNKIVCLKTGSTFTFRGLSEKTEQSIKSLEAFDICWVEEAQTITAQSLSILIPTLRKKNSEFIFTFNPTLITDAVSKIFLNGTLPPNTLIEKVNYTDNPMNSETILQEAEYCKTNDPDVYEHIWLGEHIKDGDQQIFDAEMVVNSHLLVGNDNGEEIIAALDVARYGDDKSVLCVRKGNRVLSIQSWSKLGNVDLARVVGNEIFNKGIQKLVIDASGGYGGGVYDLLEEKVSNHVCELIEFYGSGKSTNPSRYANARAETYFQTAKWLRDGGVLIKNQELEDEMCIIRYRYNTKHQMLVEAKEELKKTSRLGRRPDHLDALTMTFYAEDNSHEIDLHALTSGGNIW